MSRYGNSGNSSFWVKFTAFFVLIFLGIGAVFSWIYWPEVKNFLHGTKSKVENKLSDNEQSDDMSPNDDAEEQPEETPGVEQEEENEHMSVDVVEEQGISLLALPRLAGSGEEDEIEYKVPENAIEHSIVKATVTPENATDKRLKWEVSFLYSDINMDGSTPAFKQWYDTITAAGKTVDDFIKIETYEGGLSAVVACLQPFGCTIELTVTSMANEDLTAKILLGYDMDVVSASLNCVRLNDASCTSNMDFTLGSGISFDFHGTNELVSSDNENYRVTYSLASSACTHATSAPIAKFSLDGAFKSYMEDNYGYEFKDSLSVTLGTSFNFNFFYGMLYFLNTTGKGYTTTSTADNVGLFLPNRLSTSGTEGTYFSIEFLQEWNTRVNNYIDFKGYQIGMTPILYKCELVDENNVQYGGMSFYSTNKTLFPIAVEDIRLDRSEIIF